MFCRGIASSLLVLLAARCAAAQQPNIVLIYLDDASYREFGFTAEHFGQSTQFETPNIDALAHESTILTSGYCTFPVCSPSRAGLLTGIHQSRFGFEYNISDGQYVDGLTADQRIIPSYLKDLGYTTGAMGKWHVGTQDGVNRPLDMGFDEFYGFLGGGRWYWQYPASPGSAATLRRGNTPIEDSWASEGDSSRFDPVNGRYLTDALGEEAAGFISRHAQENAPFFLSVALSAPHVPQQAKQADLDHFAHITDDNERTLAAMMYAADRAVGDVMNALQANGVDDNTIVVLANDNGGTTPYDNAPFRGGKGQLWEGGIRVPFLIRAPGVDTDVYDRPVSTLDLLPTFVSLAGGDPGALETDGVDVLPYLSGERSGDPHEVLHWRSSGNRFAIRKGDWKLARPEGGLSSRRLHDLAADPGETTNLASQQPAVVSELFRELTSWEATLQKPKWFSEGAPTMNLFDHFVYRHDVSPAASWSTPNQWRQVSGTPATLKQEDAYANAILEFQTNSQGDYVATNDMKRSTLETFMLNEIRFTGEYAGTTDHQATIDGNNLLFVNSLAGQSPRIMLEATAQPSAARFIFDLQINLQLFDDLDIDGNGTQPLEISGKIVNYFDPRGITKTGTSTVRLTGSNTYTGDTTVEAGELSITHSFLANAADVRLFSGSTLELDFVGIDTINALYFDGTTQAVGTWGAPGNLAADFHSTLITGSGLLNVASSSPQGDFNSDGVVDAADYVAWRKGLGTLYDQSDYDDWRTHFGASAGSGSLTRQAVPEPNTGPLLASVISVFALLSCRLRVVAGLTAAAP